MYLESENSHPFDVFPLFNSFKKIDLLSGNSDPLDSFRLLLLFVLGRRKAPTVSHPTLLFRGKRRKVTLEQRFGKGWGNNNGTAPAQVDDSHAL